jgi:hypothetical protein
MEAAPVAPPPLPSYDDPLTPPAPLPFDGSGSHTAAGIETPPPMPPLHANPLAQLTAKLPPKVQELIAKKPAVAYGAAAGAVGLFLLLFIVIVSAASGPSAKELAAVSSASASAVAMSPPPEAPRVKNSAPPSTLGDPEPMPMQIEMTANAAVRSVNVGNRVVEMEVPAPTALVELTPDEAGKTIALSATSVDGRAAKASWSPGDSTVQLAFGDAPVVHPTATGGAKASGGGAKAGGTVKASGGFTRPKHL